MLLLLMALACTDKNVPDSSPSDDDGDRWYAFEDCDDADAGINPGMAEIPYDGVDNDCDPTSPDDDLDGDGVPGAEDCDDGDPAVYPGAVEVCDGLDQDCNGRVDDDPSDGLSAYLDADGDGFGDPDIDTVLCEITSGWAANDDDCDDSDGTLSPAAIEICDGVDQDCDGVIDDDVPTLSGWLDADGDGFGDPASPVSGCEQLGVGNDDDCDDSDATVYPGALELQDGQDNDCDAEADEAIVAIVVGNQCQTYGATAWPTELQAVRDYLTDLALGWEEFNENPNTVEDDAYVGNFSLALFCKCGWEWQSDNQDMVDALLLARGRGTATLFFDDDIAWRQYQVSYSEDLVFLQDASYNGTHPSQALVDQTLSHPALQGPYGTPTDFTYNWDMDYAAVAGRGEIVLGTHSGGYPWWLVWEDGSSGVRSATVVASLAAANEGSVGSAAQTNLEIVFKNTVSWLVHAP